MFLFGPANSNRTRYPGPPDRPGRVQKTKQAAVFKKKSECRFLDDLGVD